MARVDIMGGETPKVLLVEDEVLVRDMVRTFLVRAGYDVLALATAEEALARGDAGDADLLLTDVMLQGKTGVELATALRQRTPQLKVVYMSGNVADDAARASVISPDARFLAKPFTRTMLLEAVRSLAMAGPVSVPVAASPASRVDARVPTPEPRALSLVLHPAQ